METPIIMQRELFGTQIRRHSTTGMLSEKDLVMAGNHWRLLNKLPVFDKKNWLTNKSTKIFISELEEQYGKENVRVPAKGRGNHTWIHPLLFIDMALAINPRLKIEVYEWLFDSLLKFSNDSGDSYKKMCGNLFVRTTQKTFFPHFIEDTENKIKLACGVSNWRTATEDQLKKRDQLHNNIALLANVLNNNSEAVRLALLNQD